MYCQTRRNDCSPPSNRYTDEGRCKQNALGFATRERNWCASTANGRLRIPNDTYTRGPCVDRQIAEHPGLEERYAIELCDKSGNGAGL